MHAFLILAHKDPELLEILVREIQPLGSIFVHLDKDSKEDFENFCANNNCHISSEVGIKWGHWTMVEATLLLVREALNQGATRLTLISGDSLPIASTEKFHGLFNSDLDICHNRSLVKTNKKARDDLYFRRYFAVKDYTKFLPRIINLIFRLWPIKINISKYIAPLDLHIGSQWWSITSQTMKKIMQYHENNPRYSLYFKKTKLSDETFFQTLIMHFSNNVRNESTTYANWEILDSPHPGKLTTELLEKAISSNVFYFARKFESSRIDLLGTWSESR